MSLHLFETLSLVTDKAQQFSGKVAKVTKDNLVSRYNDVSALLYDRVRTTDPLAAACSSLVGDLAIESQNVIEEDVEVLSQYAELPNDLVESMIGTLSDLAEDVSSTEKGCTFAYEGEMLNMYLHERNIPTPGGIRELAEDEVVREYLSVKSEVDDITDGSIPIAFAIVNSTTGDIVTWYMSKTLPCLESDISTQIIDEKAQVIYDHAIPTHVWFKSLMVEATNFSLSSDLLQAMNNENFDVNSFMNAKSNEYKGFCSDTQEYVNELASAYNSSGANGVLHSIYNRMFAQSGELAADQQNKYFYLTDQSQYKTDTFLSGFLGRIVPTALQMIGSIIALSGNIIGVGVSAIGSVVSKIVEWVNTDVENLTLAKFEPSATLSDFPIAYGQTDGIISASISQQFLKNGPQRYHFGWFSLYVGTTENERIAYEVHLHPLTAYQPTTLRQMKVSGHPVFGFVYPNDYTGHPIDSPVYPYFQVPNFETVLSFILDTRYTDPMDINYLFNSKSREEFDELVRRAYGISYTVWLLFLYSFMYDHVPGLEANMFVSSQPVTDMTSEDRFWGAVTSSTYGGPGQLVGFFNRAMSAKALYSWEQITHREGAFGLADPLLGTSQVWRPTRVVFYSDAEGSYYYDGLYGYKVWGHLDGEIPVEVSRPNLDANVQNGLNQIFTYPILHPNEGFEYIPPISSSYIYKMNGYVVTVPKYDARSFWASVALICIGAAAVAGIVTFATMKIKKAMRRSNAKSQARCESAWAAYSADPTDANLKAYEKAVKRNNFKALFTGGTKYSKSGFWDEYGSPDDSTSVTGGWTGLFGSGNTDAMDVDLNVSGIIQLIRGSNN